MDSFSVEMRGFTFFPGVPDEPASFGLVFCEVEGFHGSFGNRKTAIVETEWLETLVADNPSVLPGGIVSGVLEVPFAWGGSVLPILLEGWFEDWRTGSEKEELVFDMHHALANGAEWADLSGDEWAERLSEAD